MRILETKDGKPSKVETRYLKYRNWAEQSVTLLPNSPPSVTNDTSREGAVITKTLENGRWKSVCKGGKKPVPGVAPIMRGYADPRLALPDEPVKIGQTWEHAFGALPHLFRLQAMDWPEGGAATIKIKLEEVKDTKDGPVAVIAYSYEKKFTDEDPSDDGELIILGVQKGVGKLERNLSTYSNTFSFESMWEQNSEIIPGDVKIQMSSEASIPCKITSTEERAAEPRQ